MISLFTIVLLLLSDRDFVQYIMNTLYSGGGYVCEPSFIKLLISF